MQKALIDKNLSFDYHLIKKAQEQIVKYYSVANNKIIRINGISLGSFIKTSLSNYDNKSVVKLKKLKIECPLNDNVRLEDISNLVDFLISNKSKMINGQIFTVDGGLGNIFQETLL